MSKLLFLLTGLVVFYHGNIQSQNLRNIRASFDGEKIVVAYDLIDADPEQQFKVTFYSSHDNYTTPVTALTGDVGDAVSPGKNKNVHWNVKNSLTPDFDDLITIKVKALKIVKTISVATEPLAASTNATKLIFQPLTRSNFKRGDQIDLRWSGGSEVKKISIVLLKGNVVQAKIAENIDNAHGYVWKIPKKNKTGKKYSIQVIDSDKPDRPSGTPLFTIRPRTSMLVKAVPLVVVAGVAVLLLNNNKESSGDLPGPINPN
jgi:hypothetical protein